MDIEKLLYQYILYLKLLSLMLFPLLFSTNKTSSLSSLARSSVKINILHALLFVRCDGVEDDEEEKPFCFYNI